MLDPTARLVAASIASLLLVATIAALASPARSTSQPIATVPSTHLSSNLDVIYPITLNDNSNTMSPPAVCADGSPYRFYFTHGTGSGVKKWLVFLQGGPECFSNSSCTYSCNSNNGNCSVPIFNQTCAWGGSCNLAQWENDLATSDQQILSADKARNPVMWNWNKECEPSPSPACIITCTCTLGVTIDHPHRHPHLHSHSHSSYM